MKNEDKIILNVTDYNDIKNATSNTKYINLNLNLITKEIRDYFISNGSNYLYAEAIFIPGYIYVDYDTFVKGETIINSIISNMPNDLNEIEKCKYLYVTLGKKIGYDINVIPDKNETFSFSSLNTINNIWGSITNNAGTNSSFCKLYFYLCKLVNISCEIIRVNEQGYLCNKINVGNNSLIVDLTKDIPFIQSNFKTRYFSNYNDDISIDKKIGYLKNEDNEIKIDKVLKDIDYTKEDFLYELLIKTQNIINVEKVKPIELGIIYDYLFHKYCPNYLIIINNLYLNDLCNNKEHFILISYNDKHYSYNYKANSFILLENKILLKNIESKKIGFYLNEQLPFIEKRVVL